MDSQGRRINDNRGPITIGTDAYTASNTLLDINGNSVKDYLEDGPTITFSYAESYYCTSGTDPTPTLNFTVSGVISGTTSPTGTFSSSPTGLVFQILVLEQLTFRPQHLTHIQSHLIQPQAGVLLR